MPVLSLDTWLALLFLGCLAVVVVGIIIIVLLLIRR